MIQFIIFKLPLACHSWAFFFAYVHSLYRLMLSLFCHRNNHKWQYPDIYLQQTHDMMMMVMRTKTQLKRRSNSSYAEMNNWSAFRLVRISFESESSVLLLFLPQIPPSFVRVSPFSILPTDKQWWDSIGDSGILRRLPNSADEICKFWFFQQVTFEKSDFFYSADGS